jgi:hypothetical protein
MIVVMYHSIMGYKYHIAIYSYSGYRWPSDAFFDRSVLYYPTLGMDGVE